MKGAVITLARIIQAASLDYLDGRLAAELGPSAIVQLGAAKRRVDEMSVEPTEPARPYSTPLLIRYASCRGRSSCAGIIL